jgi:MATE family multidrug resistance protein
MMFLCTLVMGLTNLWVAGRIDPDVQAAIGLSSQIQGFLLVLAMALGSGAMAAVSQSIGAGRGRRSKRYAGLVVTLAAGVAVVLASAMFFLRAPLLAALQVPQDLRPSTLLFVNVVLLSLPALYVMQIGGVLFRAARNVTIPLLVAGTACAVDMLGALGFGLGWFGLPRAGTPGVAWSMFAATYAGAALTLRLLGRARLFPPGFVPPLRWVRRAAPYLLKVALPAMLASFLWQTGYLVVFGITAALPDSAASLAGLTTGMRIEAILFMPGVAFSMTASILVGNLLGAGDKAGAKRVGLATVCTGVAAMSLVAACMWPWMDELARVFSPDSAQVRTHIVAYLIFNILSTPFTVGSMILGGIMTGAGATVYSLVVNTACIWLVRVPLGWFLAHAVLRDAKGVFIAMLVSMTAQALCMLWVFFRRDWTRYAMRPNHHLPPTNAEAAREHA